MKIPYKRRKHKTIQHCDHADIYCQQTKLNATNKCVTIAGDLRKKIEDQNGKFFDEQVVCCLLCSVLLRTV